MQAEYADILQGCLDEDCHRVTPVCEHFESCDFWSTEIRRQSSVVNSANSVDSLLTLEALCIRDLQQQVNTKHEFRFETDAQNGILKKDSVLVVLQLHLLSKFSMLM